MTRTMTIAAACVAVFLPLGAQPGSAAMMKGLDARLGLEVEYNDNVFEFSDSDRDAFDPAAAKFQGLESVDDWIVIPNAAAEYRLPAPYGTRFFLEARPKFFLENTVKNYQVYTARVRQELPKEIDLRLQYTLVPSFFLRRLSEPPNQSQTYADAEFRIDTLKLSLGRSFSESFGGALTGTWEKKNYDAPFDERDTTIAAAGMELSYRPWKTFRVILEGNYEWARAAGWDDPAFNSDISYDLWSLRISPSYRATRWLTISAGYTYESKEYITDLIHDGNHYGREDETSTMDLMLRFSIANNMSARAGYEYTDCNSNRSGATLDFGSFTKNRWLASFTYEF